MMKHISCILLAIGVVFGATVASAAQEKPVAKAAFEAASIEIQADKTRADAVVQQMTDQILGFIKVAQTQNLPQEKRIETLDELLTPVVSFGYIASRVMGKKYAKQATTDQRRAFVAAFKQSLMDTYAKGMSGFVDQEVKVVPSTKDQLKKRTINVLQTVKGANGTNKVFYTMAINKKNEWQLINVILDGIDLRKTFQMQFDRAVKTNKGNVAVAIQQWGKS